MENNLVMSKNKQLMESVNKQIEKSTHTSDSGTGRPQPPPPYVHLLMHTAQARLGRMRNYTLLSAALLRCSLRRRDDLLFFRRFFNRGSLVRG